jgi:hypothetical protein
MEQLPSEKCRSVLLQGKSLRLSVELEGMLYPFEA